LEQHDFQLGKNFFPWPKLCVFLEEEENENIK
jgi:hypothetical protein